ncbi:FliG C-terminal domain-containing protein [Deltaproteobacteria bacterium TL4]
MSQIHQTNQDNDRFKDLQNLFSTARKTYLDHRNRVEEVACQLVNSWIEYIAFPKEAIRPQDDNAVKQALQPGDNEKWQLRLELDLEDSVTQGKETIILPLFIKESYFWDGPCFIVTLGQDVTDFHIEEKSPTPFLKLFEALWKAIKYQYNLPENLLDQEKNLRRFEQQETRVTIDDLIPLTFEELFLLIDTRQLQTILKKISDQELTLALKTVNEKTRTHLFTGMSKKAAERILDDLAVMGPVKVSDVEGAQRQIIKKVGAMEEAGDIVISSSPRGY